MQAYYIAMFNHQKRLEIHIIVAIYVRCIHTDTQNLAAELSI